MVDFRMAGRIARGGRLIEPNDLMRCVIETNYRMLLMKLL